MYTWEQICEDRRFQDLPFKTETNARGQVLLTPTALHQGGTSCQIARILAHLLPRGELVIGCAVQTAGGVKRANIAWVSPELWTKVRDAYASSPAPEICVEVISKSNTWEEMMIKRQLFIGAGAREYWLCDKQGQMRFFDGAAELAESGACPGFPREIPSRR